MSRTRKRVRNNPVSPVGVRTQFYDQPENHEYAVFVDRETTVDEEHPWYGYRKLLAGEATRGYVSGVQVGGEFTSTKTSVSLKDSGEFELKAWPYSNDYLYKFWGPLVPSWLSWGSLKSDVRIVEPMVIGAPVRSIDYASNSEPWLSSQSSMLDTDEELATLGASLVGKLAPTAPHNNVFTSLGELRNDGLPSIPFLSFLKGGKLPEKVGDEYLNYQFGIAPTVSDVKSILATVNKADKLWKQYLRDSGRLVRRRMDMDPEVYVFTEQLAQPSHAVPMGTNSYHWSSVGPLNITTTVKRKRWFSAAYMYYVDESSLSGMDGWLDRAQYLYGWKPSPSGVYNLTAWSWLLDWFTNTGDVIDNISLYLEDPFLTRWAYIMEHSTITKHFSQTLVTNQSRSTLLEATVTTDVKKRRRVNPFHLGFNGEALTGHQLAILAALGLTKGSNPGSM